MTARAEVCAGHEAILSLVQAGREGVEAAWEGTDEFHEAWKAKARDMLARAEWRRRKLTKRVRARLPPPAWPQKVASESIAEASLHAG
jgi:hypothetical protein